MARPKSPTDDPDDNEESDRRLGIVSIPKTPEGDDSTEVSFPMEEEEPDEGRDFAGRKKGTTLARSQTRLRTY